MFKAPSRNRKNLGKLSLLLALNAVLLAPSVHAKKAWNESPLDEKTQSDLRRVQGMVKSGHAAKATPIIMLALQSANDMSKCLAIAAYTENTGYPLQEPRRACLQKALSFCQSRQDYLQVALRARQYECFEVTREAVNSLIAQSSSAEDLIDLAKKSQEVALNDVATLAVNKAYAKVKTVPDALALARQAKLLGMEDMNRKIIKDLIDDESNGHELMVLLKEIEPFDLKDLNRYCMKKALDHAANTTDLMDIYNAAQRHGEKDIFELALYRGKRGRMIEQYNAQKAEYQKKVAANGGAQKMTKGC